MLIYLIGYMGSGKTTAGRKLAAKLGIEYADLDELIEQKCKLSIENIFKKYDEQAFRKIEHEVLNETFLMNNTIIATGGGTPCFYDNMIKINKHGISVYIKMHINSLHDRLVKSKRKRPLLLNKSQEDIKDHITQHLKEREGFYNQAKFTIKGESLNINELVKLITS